MRRPVAVTMSVISLGAIGFSLRAGVQPADKPAATGIVATSGTPPGPRPSRRSSQRPTSAPKPSRHSQQPKSDPSAPRTTDPVSVTVNGPAVDTEYGAVQVQLVLRKKRITSAEAIAYPHGDGRTQEINSQAIPVLDQEAVQAQSGRIDTVSGATFTSDGYRQSLQAALDAAHRAGAR
ncbi:MAG TPA: FMN-binding protein [Kribbella sp.]|nr:FMN-binding protein [Kribbella sp.]